MDKGYDNNRVMDETRERGCVPIVSLRKNSSIPLDRIPYGYYHAKYAAEQVVEAAAVPYTVLRATQFHQLPAAMFTRARIDGMGCTSGKKPGR